MKFCITWRWRCPLHHTDIIDAGIVVYPRTVYTDLNGLWLLGAFGEHEMGLLPATLGLGSHWTRRSLFRHRPPRSPAPTARRRRPCALLPDQQCRCARMTWLCGRRATPRDDEPSSLRGLRRATDWRGDGSTTWRIERRRNLS